jgi:hypothetical protein
MKIYLTLSLPMSNLYKNWLKFNKIYKIKENTLTKLKCKYL